MAKLTPERKDELRAAIHRHLQVVGPKNWDALITKFPEISPATFHRTVRDVRDEITSSAAQDSPEALRIAQRRITQAGTDLPAMHIETGKHIPCTPSPAIIAGLGNDGIKHINLLSKINQVFEDGEMLREFSMGRDPEGREKIKNPVFFAKSAKLRLETAAGYLAALAQVFNFDRIQELYDIVLDEIGKASPEVQHAILLRLKAANNMHGMTVSAKL